ncbi:MAG: hypothetical protein AB2L14_06725 [Candidatus Xenobiia bacterium LiM19]
MGLEGVELVMATECEFGISITDEEAGKVFTPGMLIDLVCTKVRMSDKKTCASQSAFYRLRRALMERLKLKRDALHPSTKLKDLFQVNDVSAFWNELKKDVKAKDWPEMSRPLWMKVLIIAITLAAAAGVFVWLYRIAMLPVEVRLFSVFAGTLTAVALLYITRKFKKAVPAGIDKLSDLVRYVIIYPHTEWSRADVAEKVKQTVMEQLRIGESRYAESASFTEDLGMSN